MTRFVKFLNFVFVSNTEIPYLILRSSLSYNFFQKRNVRHTHTRAHINETELKMTVTLLSNRIRRNSLLVEVLVVPRYMMSIVIESFRDL